MTNCHAGLLLRVLAISLKARKGKNLPAVSECFFHHICVHLRQPSTNSSMLISPGRRCSNIEKISPVLVLGQEIHPTTRISNSCSPSQKPMARQIHSAELSTTKNDAEICEAEHLWEWMWRQDIPGYSGMFPCPETNEQCGRDQSHIIQLFFWRSRAIFLSWLRLWFSYHRCWRQVSQKSSLLLNQQSP